MGLDNIPHHYPCLKQDLAIMTANNKIDCNATIGAGRCPYKRANPPAGQILGMLGTECWYRGKVGNWMTEEVEEITGDAAPHSWYGNSSFGDDREEEADIDPAECIELADWLADRGEKYLDHKAKTKSGDELKEEGEAYAYAVWWLRWVAENCDGADAWY